MQQEKENPQKDLQKSFLPAPLTAAHTWHALSWKEPSPVPAQVWQRNKCKASPSIFPDSAGKFPFPQSSALPSSPPGAAKLSHSPAPQPTFHQHPSLCPSSPNYAFLCQQVAKHRGHGILAGGGIWAPMMKKPLQSWTDNTRWRSEAEPQPSSTELLWKVEQPRDSLVTEQSCCCPPGMGINKWE